MSTPAKEQDHDYTSTACYHGKHDRCRRQCKFCSTPCRCSCGHPVTTHDDCELSIVEFSDLDVNTRQDLRVLTNTGRSKFRSWLDVPASFGLDATACVAKRGDVIVGWSAMCYQDVVPSQDCWEVGVYVEIHDRGHGLARSLVNRLLTYVSGTDRAVPKSVFYSKHVPWMHDLITTHGFNAEKT